MSGHDRLRPGDSRSLSMDTQFQNEGISQGPGKSSRAAHWVGICKLQFSFSSIHFNGDRSGAHGGPGGLTESHTQYMENHMKTTLNIDDEVMIRLKQEAALRRTTVSELVETALRRLLNAPVAGERELQPLPTFDGGGALVDISDRQALYEAMEGR